MELIALVAEDWSHLFFQQPKYEAQKMVRKCCRDEKTALLSPWLHNILRDLPKWELVLRRAEGWRWQAPFQIDAAKMHPIVATSNELAENSEESISER